MTTGVQYARRLAALVAVLAMLAVILAPSMCDWIGSEWWRELLGCECASYDCSGASDSGLGGGRGGQQLARLGLRQ